MRVRVSVRVRVSMSVRVSVRVRVGVSVRVRVGVSVRVRVGVSVRVRVGVSVRVRVRLRRGHLLLEACHVAHVLLVPGLRLRGLLSAARDDLVRVRVRARVRVRVSPRRPAEATRTCIVSE